MSEGIGYLPPRADLRQAYSILDSTLLAMHESRIHAEAGNGEHARQKLLEFRKALRHVVRLTLDEVDSTLLAGAIGNDLRSSKIRVIADLLANEHCNADFIAEAIDIIREETTDRMAAELLGSDESQCFRTARLEVICEVLAQAIGQASLEQVLGREIRRAVKRIVHEADNEDLRDFRLYDLVLVLSKLRVNKFAVSRLVSALIEESQRNPGVNRIINENGLHVSRKLQIEAYARITDEVFVASGFCKQGIGLEDNKVGISRAVARCGMFEEVMLGVMGLREIAFIQVEAGLQEDALETCNKISDLVKDKSLNGFRKAFVGIALSQVEERLFRR